MGSKLNLYDENGAPFVLDGQHLKNLSGIDPRQLATAWVIFDSDSNILSSFNVSSVTDTGTGTFDIIFESEMDTDNYVFSFVGLGGGAHYQLAKMNTVKSTTKLSIIMGYVYSTSGALEEQDAAESMIIIFGGKNTPAPAAYEIFPQSGSNERGNWIKHADGTLLCYGSVSAATKIETWIFPMQFIDNPIVTASSQVPEESNYTASVYSSSSSSTEIIRFYNGSATTNPSRVNIQAIGKWK